MISTKTKEETEVFIKGPAGELELLVGAPEEENRKSWGIVCHPHPLYGGTMHNKVVTTLVKVFQDLGLNTIRFNFRGIGRSVGEFDNGDGELQDLLAVIDWVQRERSSFNISLAGFSFGAYIAAKAAAQIPVERLITIAPPVHHFPMQNLAPIICPWVLVQGEQDDVVPPNEVLAWAEKRVPPPKIIRMPQAGHFFHGQLGELRMKIEEALGNNQRG